MITIGDTAVLFKLIDYVKNWYDSLKKPKVIEVEIEHNALSKANKIVEDFRHSPGGLRPAVPLNAKEEIAYLFARGEYTEEKALDILTGRTKIYDNGYNRIVQKGFHLEFK